MKSLAELTAGATVLTSSVRELRAALENGHRVEYWLHGPKGRQYVICEKRGKEYVTAYGDSEAGAREAWKRTHEKGHYYDALNRRINVPGAR